MMAHKQGKTIKKKKSFICCDGNSVLVNFLDETLEWSSGGEWYGCSFSFD